MSRGATFRSLRNRNYRLFFRGQLVSVAGTWTQTVAQGWLVLQLSHNNTIDLGLVTAVQLLPTLFLGAWGGLLADRLDKRKLIMFTQSGMAVSAAVLAAVTFAGAVELWMVYAVALVNGLLTAPDFPARQSFVPELVPDEDLVNAVSLNSAVFNAGRVVGPAIAGVLLAVANTASCFAVNAASYLCVIVALLMMNTAQLRPPPRLSRAKGQVRSGIRAAWDSPPLRSNILLMGVMGSIGLLIQPMLPAFAKISLGGTATTYSLLAVAIGVGAVGGALRLATVGGNAKGLVRASVLCGLLVLATAFMPTTWAAAAILPVVGWFMITALATSNSLVQLDAPPQLRGRITALRSLMVVGSQPVGALLGGWISHVLGPRWAIGMGGAATAVTALALAPSLLRASRPGVQALAGTDGPRPDGPDAEGDPLRPAPAAG